MRRSSGPATGPSLRHRRGGQALDIERSIKMASARHMANCDERVLAGTPVVGGTRVPVAAVATMLGTSPMAEVLRAFPELTPHQVELCAFYDEASRPTRRIVVERAPRRRPRA